MQSIYIKQWTNDDQALSTQLPDYRRLPLLLLQALVDL